MASVVAEGLSVVADGTSVVAEETPVVAGAASSSGGYQVASNAAAPVVTGQAEIPEVGFSC